MVTNTNHTTTTQGYRLAPPPVRPADCATAFEAGDTLLIDARLFPGSRAKEIVVTVEKVSVNIYALSEGRSYRSVLYGLRSADAHGPFGNSYHLYTEAELKRRFVAYVWWLP